MIITFCMSLAINSAALIPLRGFYVVTCVPTIFKNESLDIEALVHRNRKASQKLRWIWRWEWIVKFLYSLYKMYNFRVWSTRMGTAVGERVGHEKSCMCIVLFVLFSVIWTFCKGSQVPVQGIRYPMTGFAVNQCSTAPMVCSAWLPNFHRSFMNTI